MKTCVRIAVAALVGAAAASAGLAAVGGSTATQLLVVGPVEAVNTADATATILGQRVHTALAGRLTVGNEVAVFGTRLADGTIAASSLQSPGLYVPGASPIYLSGTVQKAEPSLGRVVVNGVTVDLTTIMSYGTVSLDVGSKVAVSGTQPVSGGRVLVSGLTGSGVTTNAITGSGVTTNAITGSGVTTNAITGSGVTTNAITGSGTTVNGMSGRATTVNGISGSS